MPIRRFFVTLFVVTFALRLCHSQLLWPDEDYHLAAAQQLLRGKVLYRDIWYDKPPLSALVYALVGAPTGWLLRFFDSIYVFAVCAAAYRFARELWGEAEGLAAAGILAFFLSFDIPAGVIPIAPDFLMLLPHLLAVWFAWRGRSFASGGWCGIAFLFNPKAAFVLVACGAFLWPSLPLFILGFLIPNAAAFGTLYLQGALMPYAAQVWRWGLLYAKNPPATSTGADGLRRTVDWLLFHLALPSSAIWFWFNERSRTARLLMTWSLISFAAVASGGRFAPRYFLQVLPPLALVAARCLTVSVRSSQVRRRTFVMAGVLFAVPVTRFGPRYALLAADAITQSPGRWNDTALDRDSRAAAQWLRLHQRPGDTLLVWGYRPDVFAFSRIPAATRFLDSQPLTGVPADRHLRESKPLTGEWAGPNRLELTQSSPTFIVDGLSRLNPHLAIENYPEIRDWLRSYRVVRQTGISTIYQRATP